MSAQSPGAYGLSALLHAAVVALVLFFSYASTALVKDTPRVFELVAGAGDNYGAREAPALGSPGGVKLQAAPVPRPQAPPVPKVPKEEASPIQSAPEAKPAKPAKPVDLVAQLNRTMMRKELNLERKYEKEKEAEEKREAAAAKVAHIDAEGIKEGVLGGSKENKTGGAGGRALTREEGSLLEAYFALLKARIKENHVPPEGVSDRLSARVEFFVAADGSISSVRIVSPSGNFDFDRSVIEAVEHTRSIGPRPDARSESVTMAIKMSDDESP
jgi:colicin import membrane protein